MSRRIEEGEYWEYFDLVVEYREWGDKRYTWYSTAFKFLNLKDQTIQSRLKTMPMHCLVILIILSRRQCSIETSLSNIKEHINLITITAIKNPRDSYIHKNILVTIQTVVKKWMLRSCRKNPFDVTYHSGTSRMYKIMIIVDTK